MSDVNAFDFIVTDADKGIEYHSWTDGHCIGYEVHFPTGEIRFIYLCPSTDSDGGTPDVFVYMGSHADPAVDAAMHYYDTALDSFPVGPIDVPDKETTRDPMT